MSKSHYDFCNEYLDVTHRVPIQTETLELFGYFTEAIRLFTEDKLDTIVAYKPRYSGQMVRE